MIWKFSQKIYKWSVEFWTLTKRLSNLPKFTKIAKRESKDLYPAVLPFNTCVMNA
jgi:hypothetical protein